jgi:hypothetical protein
VLVGVARGEITSGCYRLEQGRISLHTGRLGVAFACPVHVVWRATYILCTYAVRPLLGVTGTGACRSLCGEGSEGVVCCVPR